MIRLSSQYADFVINILIVLFAIISFYIRSDKRPSLFVWVLFGLAGSTFYTVVLLFGNRTFGNDFSPIRNLIQDSLVASALFWLTFGDIRNGFKCRK